MRKYVKSSPGNPQLFVFCILGVVRLYFSALRFLYLYFVYVCLSRVLYFYVHLYLYSLFWVFTYMADDEDDNEERRLPADERLLSWVRELAPGPLYPANATTVFPC